MLCSSLSFAWSKFIGLFQHKSPESKYRISKGNDDYTKEYGDKTEEEFTVIPTEQKPKKEKLDIRDFMFSGQIDQQLLYKPPGSISGRAEFIIENCKNCRIVILDHTVQVSVDQCENCKIFIGPCEGRECKNCIIMATCQQFRTRDCTALDCYLHVTTQPIIEKSNRMRFGCFHASYTELDRQLSSANLCRWSNEWWRLHDFNWKGGMKNYELMLPPYNATELSEAFQFPCSELDGFGFEKSAVPLTSGVKRSDKQSVLVFPLTAEKKLLFELVPQWDICETVKLEDLKKLGLKKLPAGKVFIAVCLNGNCPNAEHAVYQSSDPSVISAVFSHA